MAAIVSRGGGGGHLQNLSTALEYSTVIIVPIFLVSCRAYE